MDPTIQEILAEHESLLEFVYLCPIGIVQISADGRITMMNSMATQLAMQLDPSARLENLYDVLSPHVPELKAMADALTADQGTICEGQRIEAARCSPGAPFPLVLSLTLVRLSPSRTFALMADISRSAAQERAVRQAEERFRAILDGVRDYAIFGVSRDGIIESWNRSAQRLYGYPPEDVIGRHYRVLFSEDTPGVDRASLLIQRAIEAGWGEDEGWWTRKASTRFWGNSVLSVVENESGEQRGFTVITRDLSRRKRADDEVVRAANTDFLTGVGNRRCFTELAQREMERWHRTGDTFSVIMFDADRFKLINDTYGHGVGDEVLKAFAKICRDEIRDADLVARFGGEEFVVLLGGTDAIGARGVAERIRLVTEAARLRCPQGEVRFTVSAGVATIRGGVADIDTLLRAADQALYDAKRRGRNRTVVAFDAGGAERASDAAAS